MAERELSERGELRALHVIAGLSPTDGGPSYSVPRLCGALAADTDTEVTLLTVVRQGEGPDDCAAVGFQSRAYPQSYARIPLLKNLRLSAGFDRALDSAAASAQVVHNHGLWLMPNVRAGWAARRLQRPLIVSPRGMLSPSALSFSRLRKQLFWRLLQGSVVRGAACIHVTGEAEYEEVRALGLSNPVAVIANGIDLPEQPADVTAPQRAERTVLSLGRIHPKKGLERLVRAWAMVEPSHPDWRLRIAGPAEGGHDAELKAFAVDLGLSRVTIEGPIYDPEKLRAFVGADLFVLPSLNENFAMTVAESLAAGTPVISTIGAPWRGLQTHGCGWWVDHGPDPLAAALTEAMAMPARTLREMGARGRDWMARDFSWQAVATDMASVYRWLARNADAPACVRFD